MSVHEVNSLVYQKKNSVDPRVVSTRGQNVTAYGFPTVYSSNMPPGQRRKMWLKAGPPGVDKDDYKNHRPLGNHDAMIENERLVPRTNQM